jgi:predicted transglutaminase-like cysteine proteinase
MLGIRMAVTVVSLGLLVGICGCSSKAAAKPTIRSEKADSASLIKPGPGLFKSHEFRSTLKALPDWKRVMASADQQTKTFADCQKDCSSAALSWQKMLRQTATLPPYEQLKTVNSFFNRWPYRLDIDVYGVNDYWATPEEFLKLSGDCEDYSITKYYALKQLGFAVDDLRIVLLKDSIRNMSHAVLAVNYGEDIYILDNMSDLLLSHLKYDHYIPQYSVNEFHRWAHVSPQTIY